MKNRISSGIDGLDEILKGGFICKRAYLIRGGPGSGKTTLGYHFLMDGVKKGERTLFITLGEPEHQLKANAGGLELDLKGVEFLDLTPSPDFFTHAESYDIFSPAEVEREPVTQMIVNKVETLKPSRVFIDSMTQFRYLAPDTFQFRKQVLSLIRFLIENGATILFTSEASIEAPDNDLMFLSDGVINLEVHGAIRTIEVLKFRGSEFIPGLHSYKLGRGGIKVFSRLIPEQHTLDFEYKVVSSGISEVDELLRGGLEMGTITMISGPTGVGKTTLSMSFLKEAASRNEKSLVYSFEEREEELINRCESVNIPIKSMIESGKLRLRHVEPLTLLPDEFGSMVREDVEQFGAKVALIDSTSGYEMVLGGKNPRKHLHAVCKYMSNMGLLVLLTTEIKDITGTFKVSEHQLSYLADNIIFLRYMEIGGELRRALGVLKKRLGDFEKTFREYSITPSGIKVGEPLRNFRNILSGIPEPLE